MSRLLLSCVAGLLLGRAGTATEPPVGLSPADAMLICRELSELGERLSVLRGKDPLAPSKQDLLADAEVYRKGVSWAIRYEAKLESADVALLKKSQKRGGERASAIADVKPMWTTRPGKFVRGYVSAVDGSVQPYGVIIPSGYDPKKPTRLDVVLHGRWRRCRG